MSQDPDRRWSRRWWVIGGLVAALVVLGAAAVYAGVRIADDGEPRAELIQPSPVPPSTPPAWTPPSLLPPTAQPGNTAWDICLEVQTILWDMIDVDADYVQTRRMAADRIRALTAPTAALQAELDELADELDSAAQMVEDDPTAEAEAFDREDAASSALIDSGECI